MLERRELLGKIEVSARGAFVSGSKFRRCSHCDIASYSYELPAAVVKGYTITCCVMGQRNSEGTSVSSRNLLIPEYWWVEIM
jgi:hypothetical protein